MMRGCFGEEVPAERGKLVRDDGKTDEAECCVGKTAKPHCYYYSF